VKKKQISTILITLPFVAAVFAAGAISTAVGEESQSTVNLPDDVANSSIIWLTDSAKVDEVADQIDIEFEKFSAKFKENHPKADPVLPKITGRFSALRAIAVSISPANLQSVLANLPASVKGQIDGVGADAVITAEDCPDSAAVPLTATAHTPVGVSRVLKLPANSNPTSVSGTVWVIDSGVDNVSKALMIDDFLNKRAADCSSGGPCTVATKDSDIIDELGHGTMVAGIIAAKPPGSVGVYGVAPGATVIPIKVFGKKGYTKLAKGPLRGLDYVYQYFLTYKPHGDVVNISWGGDTLGDLNRYQLKTVQEIVSKLHKLSDLGVKVTIAAGNMDSETRASWVQFVIPAAAGSYPSPFVAPGPPKFPPINSSYQCNICTVSAVESTWDGHVATDKFWWDPPNGVGSNYGNYPPDYAEPGVNVESLWKMSNSGAAQANKCSGTSFAAPHLAGIMLRGNPSRELNVSGDPSGNNDPSGYNLGYSNPVGVFP
jgi:subtilase family protein